MRSAETVNLNEGVVVEIYIICDTKSFIKTEKCLSMKNLN